ncbi:MAG: radical SAM family heme chaperone HemW [Castellaniella sp.]|uniref:radical SAM family heme chaperone HemW n=1 Tax=Castellaniella sp. TaxID=1955812 RepID=UPI002A3698B4|nr:radical SAM family heme chaperone HemW [Castellaniella sp.]MDY0309839.1 radical SAM family heme chaperone HemW [Castellaniella sp.]
MKRLIQVPLPERAGDGRPGVRGKPGLAALPPLSLYVHVPWCVRKCPYCDFNSHERAGELPEQAYLQALQADLEQAVPDVWGRQVATVFFGGGTPSLLSADAVDRIIGLFRAYLNLPPDAEITLEANPGTAEAARFQGYAQAGVNRISLGIQSFDDDKLRRLGRIHDAAQARAAIEMAQHAVDRVNLDLMFALPQQTLAECERDVREALAFGTGHLSLYHLTLEPNTVFAKYPPPVPDDELGAAMQDRGAELIQAAGFDRYEVSAYARPQQACQHNLNYWRFGDYLGIGPGAHSKISFQDRITRQARARMPDAWMRLVREGEGRHVVERRELNHDDLGFEFMLNALRLREGVEGGLFIERTGLSLMALLPALRRAAERGLLEPGLDRLCATPHGWRFLNELQMEFLN